MDLEIRRETLGPRTDADFDREAHVIRVCDTLGPVEAHIALAHELLHVVETLVPRVDGGKVLRVPHRLLNVGDAILLSLLVEAGLYRGISRTELARHRKKSTK